MFKNKTLVICYFSIQTQNTSYNFKSQQQE